MRVFLVILIIIGGYLVSVPLFGHRYGITEDGKVTYILNQKDRDDCAKSTIASESGSGIPDEAIIGLVSQICNKPAKTIEYDWFYLMDVIGGVFEAKAYFASHHEPEPNPGLFGWLDVLIGPALQIAVGAAILSGIFFVIFAMIRFTASLWRRRERSRYPT